MTAVIITVYRQRTQPKIYEGRSVQGQINQIIISRVFPNPFHMVRQTGCQYVKYPHSNENTVYSVKQRSLFMWLFAQLSTVHLNYRCVPFTWLLFVQRLVMLIWSPLMMPLDCLPAYLVYHLICTPLFPLLQYPLPDEWSSFLDEHR